MIEIWKDIVGYEGLYQVSNLGRVKSVERRVWNGVSFALKREKLLSNNRICKGKGNRFGYIHVSLRKNGKAKNLCVHKLVANAFLDNPLRHKEVDHLDNNSLNNNVENLKWVNRRENIMNPNTKGYLWKNFIKYKFGNKSGREIALTNGLKESTFYNRLRIGWSVEKALTTPVRGRNI